MHCNVTAHAHTCYACAGKVQAQTRRHYDVIHIITNCRVTTLTLIIRQQGAARLAEERALQPALLHRRRRYRVAGIARAGEAGLAKG